MDRDAAPAFALSQARPYTAKWTLPSFAGEIARTGSVFLVAEDGEERLRGYALARVVQRDCMLLDLAVEVDGVGFGRALLRALAHAAGERGCSRISLEASSANERALSFYAKAGAKVVGRRPKFYNDGSDAVLMDIEMSNLHLP